MNTIYKICFLISVVVLFSSCGYNHMVELEEGISGQWANVESSYQRRADLIPNLVATVKAYAEHEQETFTKVTEARAKATQISINVDELNAETIQKFQAIQADMSSALTKLLAVAEAYPDLKASGNFREFQAQLEGTENRIAVERRKFNEAVRSYNAYTNKFPQNMTAYFAGFDEKGYFNADAGTDQAPKVNFD